MNKRVVVAMSGGVDSSVAAALLQSQGYEVIGITMCFNLPEDSVSNGSTEFTLSKAEGLTIGSERSRIAKKPRCCGLQGIEDARRVAHKLGIKHYVLNMQKVLEEKVINDFCIEYLKGRTPNPCVRCNQYVKFGALLKKALSLGADYLATGHYARVVKTKQGYGLKKAKDLKKDQSYFLYRIGQKQLKHLLFPLGNYTKLQVRELAHKFGLAVADKLESQEICFLPGTDYRSFLTQRFAEGSGRRVKYSLNPGPIVNKKGKILGQHKGIAFYTIGQREGLGIACGYPVYIIKIEPKHNLIVVGNKEEALSKQFLVKKPHFILRPTRKSPSAITFCPPADETGDFQWLADKYILSYTIKKTVALRVKIRYNHKEAQAEVIPFKSKFKVRFKIPQFAVTAGQSAVFYDKNRVIGGGIIDKIID